MADWVKDVIQVVGVGAVAAMLLALVVAPYRVSGESMLPAYKDGSVLLVNKLAYRLSKPKAGEVVVARTPHGVMVKRVVREVEEDWYWLEGDNKARSTDSREYGAVERRQIIGRAVMKLW